MSELARASAMSVSNAATLGRRVLSLFYEAVLLAAVLWLAALVCALIEAQFAATYPRILFQAYLVAVAGLYFVAQWVHGGQTLPMKTWRIKLVTRNGEPVTLRHALVRYLAALLSVASLGLGFLWALIDRERAFLHDRLAGTRIIAAPATTSSLARGSGT